MKIKKILALSLALITAVSISTGCGSKKQIVMATNAEFPPFEYITDKGLIGEFSGIDIAISLEIADKLGKELKVENMQFTSVLAAVPSGNADFAAAGMTADDERRESMDFSIPYFTAVQYIIVKGDNDSIAFAGDIVDKRVGVVQGYTGEKVCIDDLKVTNLMSYKSGMEAVADLKLDRLDVVVIDSHTALAMVNLNPELKIVEDSAAFESEQYAIAVKKGNTELLNTINEVLQDLIDSGKLNEFVATYTKETME